MEALKLWALFLLTDPAKRDALAVARWKKL
jgi:hypothetical protein